MGDKEVLAIMIPIITLGFTGLIAFTLTPLGRALAKRLGGQAGSPELEERATRLEDALNATRRELAESLERIDFAERALSQVKDLQRLPKGPAA